MQTFAVKYMSADRFDDVHTIKKSTFGITLTMKSKLKEAISQMKMRQNDVMEGRYGVR